ncbi:MAG: Rrf2 family transcriptional regulator [Candidatus Atribacteria bacterium]|nr:MAG: Rrf2 family transcriptional regulator [Candidatus Atribacteria bacterium]
MANLLKLSEATALALHTMVDLAAHGDSMSAAPMAERLCASEAHVFKVLQQLVRAGLLRSKRGPGGGYRLAKAADEITLMDVYEVFEGPMRSDGCLFDHALCSRLDCVLGGLVEDVRSRVVNHFTQTTLAQAGKE